MAAPTVRKWVVNPVIISLEFLFRNDFPGLLLLFPVEDCSVLVGLSEAVVKSSSLTESQSYDITVRKHPCEKSYRYLFYKLLGVEF